MLENPPAAEGPLPAEPLPAHASVPPNAQPARLASVDALRGFDMFWIIGGDDLLKAIAVLFGWTGFLRVLDQNLEHSKWTGLTVSAFTAYDLIFPLFLFLSGVTLSFSLTRRLEQGERKRVLVQRVFRRMALLVLLGLVYNGIFRFQFDKQRYFSVLALIGVSYFLAGLVVIHRGVRGQIIWAVGILLGYWAAMRFIPVPGYGAGVWTPEGSLGSYIDRRLMPGKLYGGVYDPEGLFTMVSAASLALAVALVAGLGWGLMEIATLRDHGPAPPAKTERAARKAAKTARTGNPGQALPTPAPTPTESPSASR